MATKKAYAKIDGIWQRVRPWYRDGGAWTPKTLENRASSLWSEKVGAPRYYAKPGSTAIAAPALLASGGTGGASHVSASFTPAANTKLVVFGAAYRTSALAAKPTITDSAGLTWTELGSVHTSNTTTADLYMVAWISNDVGASPASMTVTIASTSGSQVGSVVSSLVSAEISGAALQTATGEDLANGDPSFTFGSAPNSKSLTLAGVATVGGNNVTSPTGFTELADVVVPTGGSRRLAVAYDATSPTAGPHQHTSTNTRTVVLALEMGINIPATAAWTFAACDLGTPHANRIVIVPIAAIYNGLNRTISSVTINGVTASAQGNQRDVDDGVWMYAANVPSGATGDIVITFSGTGVNTCGIAVYDFQRSTTSPTATEMGLAAPNGTPPIGDTMDPGADELLIGFGFGATGVSSVDDTWSWGGSFDRMRGRGQASLDGAYSIRAADVVTAAGGFGAVTARFNPQPGGYSRLILGSWSP